MKLKLPDWLKRDDVKLPEWASYAKKQDDRLAVKIEIDSDKAYPYWLDLLGVQAPDQYWLEVAYQCIKLDVQMALAGSKYDPRVAGRANQFNFSRSAQWALADYPPGKGIAAASQGKEARGHYIRIRGRMPA